MRVDPSNNFKPYTGEYNITNQHYWSSIAFTGVYGYAIGLCWLVCGMVYGGFVLATLYCSSKQKELKIKEPGNSHKDCCSCLIFLPVVFTILVTIAYGLVVGGNAKVYAESKTVVDVVMQAANEASETIKHTREAMEEMGDLLKASNETGEEFEFLASTSQELGSASANIDMQARQRRHFMYNCLKIVYVAVTMAVSLDLIIAVALTATAILRLRRALIWLIIMCWVLTAVCWFIFGIYYSIEKFSSETCGALEDFEANPNNSSLGSILHCDELLYQQPKLLDINKRIYSLVNQVNTDMSLLEANWYPKLGFVCNPFSGPPHYRYQLHNCSSDSIPLADLPKVLGALTCSGVKKWRCKSGDYKKMEAYARSIQKLLDVYPRVEDLLQCRPVKDAFSNIIGTHCRPITRFVRMVWVAMLGLSVFMLVSVLACARLAFFFSSSGWRLGGRVPCLQHIYRKAFCKCATV